MCDESCKGIWDEHMQAANHGPEKGAYNDILLIASHEYKNKGFLLWRDRMFNVYVAIGIQNILCEYKGCEID